MTNELTVRVEHPELPAIRWNETEVQQNLTEMLAAYTGRIYTPDTIKDAKADRAAVNKLDKQQAVTETKLEELTREVRAHNNFAQRVPVMEEQIKVVNHRIADLEQQKGA